VTSSYNLRCIGSSDSNETNQLCWFVFCLKKFIFGLDKSNFNDKIVSFIHLGGIYEMSDLFVQRSNYSLSLSNHKIIVKNGQGQIVKEISIHLVENLLIFGQVQVTT